PARHIGWLRVPAAAMIIDGLSPVLKRVLHGAGAAEIPVIQILVAIAAFIPDAVGFLCSGSATLARWRTVVAPAPRLDCLAHDSARQRPRRHQWLYLICGHQRAIAPDTVGVLQRHPLGVLPTGRRIVRGQAALKAINSQTHSRIAPSRCPR